MTQNFALIREESCGPLETSLLSSSIPPLLIYFSTFSTKVDAVFTNVSLEPTWRWYFAMTPFETVFLFLVIGQFAVLNTLGIMPMNLSNLINGLPSGRKKRSINEDFTTRRQIGEKILKLLKKLDPNDCTYRALCEFQSKALSSNITNFSDETKLVLSSLKRSAEKRQKKSEIRGAFLEYDDNRSSNSNTESFEQAVESGFDSFHSENSNLCQEKYRSCPVSSDELFHYVELIGNQNFFM